ncbi:MAG TPA: pyridoxamine 5'-phosphate oxidase family protein [Myxococcales bacterium]|nr:pyridoxamine 5'-phosphate oxidase family protein [Myxococcales bacterium]
MSASVFHPGEIEAQIRAGGGAEGGGIRDFISERQRAFFASLPFIVAASVDGGGPVATLLAGEAGFVSAPDAHTLRIAAELDPGDPSRRAFVAGAAAGLLGIDLAARRRSRANGVIAEAGQGGLLLQVLQSFGNCPSYIHAREPVRAPARRGRPEALPKLDAAAREAIRAADTFFVASASRADTSSGGVDVSHRGGPPGFVGVEGDALVIPDYAGNRYFNTLGNLVADPRAALLFVDFARGDLLHLQGTTEIVWHGPQVAAVRGAERIWRLHALRAFRRRGAVPLRWAAPEEAPPR